MLPRLYEESAYPDGFGNNGLGFIRDCVRCEVSEELNGAYTLTMEVSRKDPLYSMILPSMYLKIKSSNDKSGNDFALQIFEIITADGSSGENLIVNAQHIKSIACQSVYLPSENVVDEYVDARADEAIAELFDDLGTNGEFSFNTDISKTKRFLKQDYIGKKLGEILAEDDNSFLEMYGGEYKYDNFQISLLSRRGTNTGYMLVAGQHYSEYKISVTNDNIYTHVVGYATVARADVDNASMIIAGDMFELIPNRSVKKIKSIDFTEKLKGWFVNGVRVNPYTGYKYNDVKDVLNLFTRGFADKKSNYATEEEVSAVITYKPELDKMQDLRLGDTIKVNLNENNILTSEITRVVYDSLAEKYIEIDIGTQKPSLLDFIKNKRR